MSGYRVFGDWGTTRLRLFRVEDGIVTDRATGPGIGTLGIEPERALREALARWTIAAPPTLIRLCGMVGARSGWREVAYADCPTDRSEWLQAAASLSLDGVPVVIMAGLACLDRLGVPDVMRGEETQVFGALNESERLSRGDRTLVLPGTHSKWVSVHDGRIVGFRTVPTGELFALLRDHSTLASGVDTRSDDAEGYAAGLARASTAGGALSALFAARTMQLREGRSPAWALSYLSGLLIGSEIVEMTEGLAKARIDAVIGDPTLLDRYTRAFSAFGFSVQLLDGDDCALAGLGLRMRE